MRALGWTFLLLIFIALVGSGVYGYFHYKNVVGERNQGRARIAELESDLARERDAKTSLDAKLSKTLADAKSKSGELEKLRQTRDDAEKRLATIKELTAQLKNMIDTGKLGVVTRDGRMVVQMPAEVLFESGKAELSKEGKATIVEVAKILRSDPKRKLIVAGHTDSKPISDSDFKSNWELSAARAVTVTELLVKSGYPPENLMAAGLAKYHPVAENKSEAGRQKNRRIELVVQPPELDALPQIAEVVAK